MRKKAVALVLVFIMILSLSACGSSETVSTQVSSKVDSSVEALSQTETASLSEKTEKEAEVVSDVTETSESSSEEGLKDENESLEEALESSSVETEEESAEETAVASEEPEETDPVNDGKVYEFSMDNTVITIPEVGLTEFEKWTEDLKEDTDGQIEIKLFDNVISSGDAFACLDNGKSDIIIYPLNVDFELFPNFKVFETPLIGISSSSLGAEVIWSLYEETPELQEELEDYQVLMMYTMPGTVIGADVPIYTAGDLNGLSLFTSPPQLFMSKEIGGPSLWNCSNGISCGPADTKDLIESDRANGYPANGYIRDLFPVMKFNLEEIISYMTVLPMYSYPVVVLMNKERWEELPEYLQKKLLEHCGKEGSLKIAASLDDISNEYYNKVAENGVTVITPDESQILTFLPEAAAYTDQWLAEQSEVGYDLRPLYNRLLSLTGYDKLYASLG